MKRAIAVLAAARLLAGSAGAEETQDIADAKKLTVAAMAQYKEAVGLRDQAIAVQSATNPPRGALEQAERNKTRSFELFKNASQNFEKAYRLFPAPALNYNIGVCLYETSNEKHNNDKEAEARFEKFVEDIGDDPDANAEDRAAALDYVTKIHARHPEWPTYVPPTKKVDGKKSPDARSPEVKSPDIKPAGATPDGGVQVGLGTLEPVHDEPSPPPVWKKGWFWGVVVGAVVVVGGGVGLAIAFSTPDNAATQPSTLGSLHF